MSNRLSIPKLSSNDSTASLKAYLKSIESIDVSNENPHQYVRSIENLAPFPPHFSPKNTIKIRVTPSKSAKKGTNHKNFDGSRIIFNQIGQKSKESLF